ncbi:MAG: hypothetical protein LQ347_002264 [Umbilicaria vellea]|nr:MAG: hypothetical protein LQ347_002264 [Umbilicaria vellea]
MVDIYVGPERVHYHLPLKLLAHYSPFFDRAFNGSFKEGSTKRMDLLADDVPAFNILVRWLYTGQVESPKRIEDAKPAEVITDNAGISAIPAPVLPPGSGPSPNVPVSTVQIRSDHDGAKQEPYPVVIDFHLKLFVLADKLDIRVLKNQTMDVIVRAGYGTDPLINDRSGLSWHPSSGSRFDPETIDWIYGNTSPRSPLRRLAATSAAYHMLATGGDLDLYEQCLHYDFLVDLVNGMQKHAEGAMHTLVVPTGKRCIYHDHKPDEICHARDTPSINQLHQLSADARFVWIELKRNYVRGGVTVEELVRRTGYSVAELNTLRDEFTQAGLLCVTLNDDTWVAVEV